MTTDNKLLATYVVYKDLYKDKDTDVYDIISEFVKNVIIEERKLYYTQSEISRLVNSNFGFKIPSLVLKPAIGRVLGLKLTDGKYYVDYSVVKSNIDVSRMQEDAINNNKKIQDDLFESMEQQNECTYNDIQKEEINIAFRKYILDESVDDAYIKDISAFIIEKSRDAEYVQRLNKIREGHILYSGLSLNEHIDEQGWRSKLVIYLDMEILFHLAGYNGVTFQRIADDFVELVNEANRERTYITLKFFQETKNRIDEFFNIAETIFEMKQLVKPGETAMESIVNGCKAVTDITDKKSKFFYFLKKKNIIEEKKDDFYSKKYESANLEELQETGKEQSDLRLISHINKLRRDEVFSDYADVGFILLSETGTVLNISRKITFEKEKKLLQESGQKRRIVPFAVNLYTITNVLWYRLCSSFNREGTLATVDAVIRAQIVLSKFINESIVKQYDELIEKQKNGAIDRNQLSVMIINLRQRSKKPENIVSEGMDDSLKYLCETDINKALEDYNEEKEKLKRLEYDNALKEKEIRRKEEEVSRIQREKEKDKCYYNYMIEKKTLEVIEKRETEVREKLDYQNVLCEKSKKKRRNMIVGVYVLYYIILVICVVSIGWDTMEPITFLFGVPPLIYATISKYIKISWSIQNWIGAYQNKAEFKKMQDEIACVQEELSLQQKKVEKYKEIYSTVTEP